VGIARECPRNAARALDADQIAEEVQLLERVARGQDCCNAACARHTDRIAGEVQAVQGRVGGKALGDGLRAEGLGRKSARDANACEMAC